MIVHPLSPILDNTMDFDSPHNTHHVHDLNDLPLVLCIEDLMAVLCIGRNTAYALVRSGQIRSIKVGKIYRIPRDAVEEFLKK